MFTYFLYHQLYNRSTYAHMINHLTDAKEKNFKNVEEKYFKTLSGCLQKCGNHIVIATNKYQVNSIYKYYVHLFSRWVRVRFK